MRWNVHDATRARSSKHNFKEYIWDAIFGIYLDGVEQSHVILFDEERGVMKRRLTRKEKSATGRDVEVMFVRENKNTGEREVAWEEMKGKVEVRFKGDDEWRRPLPNKLHKMRRQKRKAKALS